MRSLYILFLFLTFLQISAQINITEKIKEVVNNPSGSNGETLVGYIFDFEGDIISLHKLFTSNNSGLIKFSSEETPHTFRNDNGNNRIAPLTALGVGLWNRSQYSWFVLFPADLVHLIVDQSETIYISQAIFRPLDFAITQINDDGRTYNNLKLEGSYAARGQGEFSYPTFINGMPCPPEWPPYSILNAAEGSSDLQRSVASYYETVEKFIERGKL